MVKKIALYARAYSAYRMKKTTLNYPPIQVSIEPTNVCNFKCSFCNQSDPDHFALRKAGKISLQDYETVLDKIKNECANVNIISLTLDGEPALHKDLPRMIEKANQKGFFVRFSSNGALIDRAFLQKTGNLSYLISVDFSLDKSGFEKNRGDWPLVEANLKDSVAYLGVNKNLRLEIFENSAYYAGQDGAASNLRLMKKHFGKTPGLTYGLRVYHKIIDGKPPVPSGGKYYGCFYPWTSLTVAWNCDAVTCCRDLDGKYVLGNLLQSSIDEVWNGKKYLLLREAILKRDLEPIPSCASCDLPYDDRRNSWNYIIRKVSRKW
ncbi:MAG: radical SAM/SPASM domain-containing protein [bacterium]